MGDEKERRQCGNGGMCEYSSMVVAGVVGAGRIIQGGKYSTYIAPDVQG